MPELKSIEMGSDSFKYVSELKLIGMSGLKSVVIGGGCCVKWSGFVMRNCDVVEVSIGDGCFVNCENTVFESES